MYGNGDRALKQSLRQMAVEAWNECLGKGIDCTAKLSEHIQSDLRFKDFDATRLATETLSKVRQGGSNNIDLAGTRSDGKAPYLGGRIGINHRGG